MHPVGGNNPLEPAITGTSQKSSRDEYIEAPSPITSEEAKVASLIIVSFA
jgi:hypothetical protein